MQRNYKFAYSACLLILFSTPTVAENKAIFGGFISQGVVHTTANTFFDKKDSTSFELTEVALQASYLLGNNWRFAGQGIYRNWGKLEGAFVDYLFADYAMVSAADINISARLGRIKTDWGLFNVTREVPSARPSTFLPQSIYLDILRNSSTSYDGLSIYGSRLFELGTLSWNLAYGENVTDDELVYSIFGDVLDGHFDSDNSGKFSLAWEPNNSHWLLAFSAEEQSVNFTPKISPNAQFATTDGSLDYDRFILSGQYFTEKWDLTAELIYVHVDTNGFDLFIPGLPPQFQPQLPDVVKEHHSSDGGYIQFRYLLNDELTLLTRYDVFFRDRDERYGSDKLTAQQLPGHTVYSKDFTTALKWQINERWVANLEAHLVEGTAYISPWVRVGSTLENEKYWEMLSLEVSYSF